MKQFFKKIIFIVFFFPLFLNAQEETDFELFLKQSQQEFNNFRDTINRHFANQLRTQWKEFQVFKGVDFPAKPKPKHQPIAPQTTPEEIIPQQLPRKNIVPDSSAIPVERHEENPFSESDSENIFQSESDNEPTIPLPQEQTPANFSFSYCGIECNVIQPSVKDNLLLIPDNQSIANFWEELDEIDFSGILQQCRFFKKQNGLNDWGMFDYVLHYSAVIFPNQPNQQNVFTVYLLNQLGYDAKVCYTKDKILILLAIKQQVYAIPYLGQCRYYILNEQGMSANLNEPVFTYNFSFPKPTIPLDMHIFTELFPESDAYYDKSVQLPNSLDKLTIRYKPESIEYYRNYPQMDIDIYASAAVSNTFMQSIREQFMPQIDGLSEREAVSFLLSYVQYSFDYEMDTDQFGYEKPFFCEENFYYLQNDCEDRSVLFSFLVRELLGLKVILLDYPDHIATAVAFTDNVNGDYFLYENRKYVVCDPTYIGAVIGQSIPEYKNVAATIIDFD